MTNDPTPTPVPQSLIVELIHSISSNTEELHKLRAEVEQLARDKRSLIRDVACMSRGITEFRKQFEPYLVRAVESENTWKGWRKSWVQLAVGTFIVGFLIWIGNASLNAAGEWVAAFIAAKEKAPK